METPTTCSHCGGVIGPDITERPMCYGCGPVEMVPRERPEFEPRHTVGVSPPADWRVSSCFATSHPLLRLLR